jgi:phospholipid/cholesterol/gamma-HCH transport system permease protein
MEDKAVIEELSKPSEIPFTKALKGFFEEVTLLTKFTLRFFREVFKPRYEFNEFVKQSYLIGYKSFP